MNKYKNIKTKDNYEKTLKSGMFWEFYPELSGEWEKDMSIINPDDIRDAGLPTTLTQQASEGNSVTNTKKASVESKPVSGSFSVGDKVIWDSHFGYDIAIFLGEGAAYEHWEIELHSGKFNGTDTMVSKSELHHYSKELIAKMSKQYGYEKDWSDVF